VKLIPEFRVGMVTHYFDRIGVAVVELSGVLSLGETIRIGNPGFTQPVDSIQVEHEKVDSANKGDSVGLKVSQRVKKGDEVFKVS